MAKLIALPRAFQLANNQKIDICADSGSVLEQLKTLGCFNYSKQGSQLLWYPPKNGQQVKEFLDSQKDGCYKD